MNLFSTRAAQEAAEAKKDALCTIIVNNLKDTHNKKVQEIQESDAFKNFEANLLKTDSKAAQLNNAIRILETAYSEALKSLEGSTYYSDGIRAVEENKDNRLERVYRRYVSQKKEETFSDVYSYFNPWSKRELIMAYLTAYDDLKNNEKIVAKVLEQLN